MIRQILIALLALLPALALAVPGTYTVTPQELSYDGTESIDGFRLYQGCDVAEQTTGRLLADPAVVGSDYKFPGDSDSPPILCAVAFNSSSESGFANVSSPAASEPPLTGQGTLIIEGCRFVTETGEEYSCTLEVQ